MRLLAPTRAAIVQLSVPVLAAIGGVLFLSEAVTHRLLLSGIVILGGIALIGVAKGLGGTGWPKQPQTLKGVSVLPQHRVGPAV